LYVLTRPVSPSTQQDCCAFFGCGWQHPCSMDTGELRLKNICEIIYFAMADVNVFLFVLLLLLFVGLTVMNFAFCDVFMLRACISVPANGGFLNPVFILAVQTS
jgi:hypothetical protein